LFPKGFHVQDDDFVIRNGVLERGQLKRDQLHKIIRVMFKDHGPKVTADFISGLQVLLNSYLSDLGCSVGLTDCLDPCPEESCKTIEKTLAWVDKIDATGNARKDGVVTQVLEKLNEQVGSKIYKSLDKTAATCPSSQHGLMQIVKSGAKGNKANIISILGMLGQQFLMSRRIQTPLPNYTAAEARTGAATHGFVAHPFSEGLLPQEYFHHAQGGRENLVDIAVKVSTTGYQERKMTKCMEDLVVYQDGSVRASDGGIHEHLYGQDGCDATFVEWMPLRTLRLSGNGQLETREGCTKVLAVEGRGQGAHRGALRGSLSTDRPEAVCKPLPRIRSGFKHVPSPSRPNRERICPPNGRHKRVQPSVV
jgi:DNA-directed RNA polymerase beta' subunit